MTFDYPGYDLQFIQRQRCRDLSAHQYTLIYKFHSPVTGYDYVLRAEYHDGDFFSLKFYCKKDSRSDYKYSKIINRGDAMNILMTCLKVIPLILKDHPTASFGFVGARSIDPISRTFEPYIRTQRYRIYSNIIKEKIGHKTFEHIQYDNVSGYLLINRLSGNVANKEAYILKMVAQTYNDLVDL